MDEQLRQKQKEIETKKREEKVDLLMKTKERKVETRVEVVDAPLEVVSAVTSSTPPVEERVKTTREEKKIVEKEEELLGASAAAATTTQQATTTPRSRTATNSATSGFVSQIANENETALFEARKKREQILNEMAQYNDAPATTKNGNTMRPGKLAETTNNKYFANRATKRTADVLGYSTTPPQNVPTDAQKEQQPKASTTSPSPSSSGKKKQDDDTKISLFAAFFAVCAFPFTLLLELFRACVEVLKKYFFSTSSGEERDAGERS
jgi:cobalamin biosynthesis Mg chelatase CobN